jgi:alkyldihydroxyacetonephosphate synthase
MDRTEMSAGSGLNAYLWDMVYSELADAVGPEHVLTAEADRLAYSVDIMWIPQMWVDQGLVPPMPDFVVLPGTVEEVARIVRIASRHRMPAIACGGQSGSQGGTLPIYGGITVDIKRLNRILDISQQSCTVTAQAGINGQHLEWELNREGLTLGHYPASQHTATLGGYLAARGSGVLSTKYGKAEDMVVNLQVVLPDGQIIRTLPTPKHAAGPELSGLFIGSEGTLGIITEVTMRLDPLPETRRFRSYLFPTLHDGLEAGRRIMLSRLHPAVIRLYDPYSTAKVVKRVIGLDVEGSYMVIGFDGAEEMVALELKMAMELCQALGGKDLGADAGLQWWEHRYDFYYPPFVKALPKLYGTTETQTTYDNIERLYEAKKRAIEEPFAEWNARYYGHFSHWYAWGVMVYDQFMVEDPPQDAHEAIRLHNELWAASARASLANGGVLNEHHGIGLKLGWFMPEQYGAAWDLLVRVKHALDPQGIMNPGKLGFGPPH